MLRWFVVPAGIMVMVLMSGLRPAAAASHTGTTPPVANAGPDVTTPIAMEGMSHANLDGTASYDPDPAGSIVSYSWTMDGNVISTMDREEMMFTEGTYMVTLTVTDDTGRTDTDDVQYTITAKPANGSPYFCNDVNGDGVVTAGDLGLVASQFGKQFGQAGYQRMVDPNADRTINAGDLGITASQFGPCSLEDQMARAATVAIEPYQNINAAFAAGFVQATQFVPMQGRHLVKMDRLDTTFNVTQPEGLLYEPDSSTPGGWRLGGALYDIPYQQYPYVPDGFPGTENETWHYHDYLCFYPAPGGGTYVTLDNQQTCTANGGTYQEKVGWLLHLWTYVTAPQGDGRYVAENTRFMGLP